MTVLRRIVVLILTLLTIDSETGAGVAIFQFSGDLVLAIARIQIANGVQIPQNNLNAYTPDARHTAWHNLALLHGGVHNYVLLPRLFTFLRNVKLHRKNLLRKRRERLVRCAQYRYRGWIFDSTLGFPGEGWIPFSVATWNPRSLTKERFRYAISLGYDILALTELWRHQSEYQTSSKQPVYSQRAYSTQEGIK